MSGAIEYGSSWRDVQRRLEGILICACPGLLRVSLSEAVKERNAERNHSLWDLPFWRQITLGWYSIGQSYCCPGSLTDAMSTSSAETAKKDWWTHLF